jgi:signal transduction histidine kinase
MTVTREGIRLAVEDDGAGANEAPVPRLGLLGIRERVVALGGQLALTTGMGTGFRLEATIPRAGDE